MIHLFICVHLLVPVRISLFRFCIIVQCTDSNHSQIIKRCPMRRNEYEWKYGVNEWGWHIKFSRNSNSSNLCYQMTKCVSTPVIYDTHTHTYHPCDKSKRKCIAIAICRATAKLIVHEITREFICVLKWARGMMMCGCCCWHHFWRAKWEYIYISVRDWTWARHHAECNGWGSCLTANTRTRSHVMGACIRSARGLDPHPTYVCV